MGKRESRSAKTLLVDVVGRYLNSGDFNGFYLGSDGKGWRRAAHTLIKRGDLEVVSESDFPNPHIRPWASRKSQLEQIEALNEALDGAPYGVCVYPTRQALAGNHALTKLGKEPYRQRMAEGSGALDLAYFRFDVLEAYRNDPTFSFDFDDFGVKFVVTDDVYLDESAPEDDKVYLRLGFAYQLPLDDEGPIIRRACVFLTDLAKLTPAHQQRWRTYEVTSKGLQPHPVWWTMQMGHWPDGIGPFEGLIYELKTWDELHTRAFGGTHLLRTTERPREFGWLMRPSQQEFDHFIQHLDKLLSENLRHEAFDELAVDRKDGEAKNHGTLMRLDLFLAKTQVDEEARRTVLKSLRDVRAARQKPAHAIRKNITDADFIRRQAELLRDVEASVRELRWLWQSHPKNQSWIEPSHMKDAKRYWL